MKSSNLLLVLLGTLAIYSFSSDEIVDNNEYTEGPVEIIVGGDPDQFPIGWSDGVCYLPIEGARVGDKVSFNSFFGHNIYKMKSHEAMENCDFSDATLLSSAPPFEYTISSMDVLKDEDSSLYFACEVGSHCLGKQRLIVNLDNSTDTSPRPLTELPVSRFILGTSSESCDAVIRGEMDPAMASRGSESECTDPELRDATDDIDRPHYFRSCLGPPITLTPGGVINQALVLHYPYPKDRRVLLGTRIWEFVQGDLDALVPVNVNQLYIHHIAGSVVLGNGAENIRQSEEDAAFKLPYGMLSGDDDDRMIFHLIDLRETGDDWLACLECRCKNGEGTYLGIGGSGSEGNGDDSERPDGGVSCCTNCTDLTTPTVDYRLRYNVTYSNITEPIDPIIMITTDIAPAIDRYVEWDVPAYPDLPPEMRLEGNPKVQVLTRVGTLRELFGGLFPGARYVGNDLLEIHRCIGHLHIAALGMWLYDDLSNELICHSDVEYGDDPKADKGFLRSISVINYDPPLEILADRKVRLVTHYDAEILHTGVMGLLFLMIAEKKNLVGMEESMMNAELCIAPECNVIAVLPNGGCRDSLEDSILCTFGGICQCDALLALKETVGGCQGTYISTFGNITVGSVCAEHCGCGEDLLEDSIVEQIEDQTKDLCHYAGKDCTRYLANVYACAQPWAEGADGFSDSVMAVVARVGKQMALDGAKIGSPALHRFGASSISSERVLQCDADLYPPKVKELEVVSKSASGRKFHPLYLFPVVVVALMAGLLIYSRKVRKNKHSQDFEGRVDGTEDIL